MKLIYKRATINRVTFYLHYKDIPDMIEKMAEEMIEDFSTVVNQTEMDSVMLVKFLEHIAENAKFYKVTLTSKHTPIFRDQLLKFITDMITTRIVSRGSESIVSKAGIPRDILIWYDSAALIGTIVAWLKNDMPYTPSYLTKQFYLLHSRSFNEEVEQGRSKTSLLSYGCI